MLVAAATALRGATPPALVALALVLVTSGATSPPHAWTWELRVLGAEAMAAVIAVVVVVVVVGALLVVGVRMGMALGMEVVGARARMC